MPTTKAIVKIYLDDQEEPLGEYQSPVRFDLDTRMLADGPHTLRIVSKDAHGSDGIREIPFVVRNGPTIDVDGLRADEVVDGVLPIMVNSYGQGDQDKFIVYGSESPRGIPAWVVVLIILFVGWALFYLFSYYVPV